MYNLEGFITDFLESEDTARIGAPPRSLDVHSDRGTPERCSASPAVTEDRSETDLYELLALMHVPTREIIDLDERAEYASYLAARAKS